MMNRHKKAKELIKEIIENIKREIDLEYDEKSTIVELKGLSTDEMNKVGIIARTVIGDQGEIKWSILDERGLIFHEYDISLKVVLN